MTDVVFELESFDQKHISAYNSEDIITWKHFRHHSLFFRAKNPPVTDGLKIHRSPLDFRHKGAVMWSFNVVSVVRLNNLMKDN